MMVIFLSRHHSARVILVKYQSREMFTLESSTDLKVVHQLFGIFIATGDLMIVGTNYLRLSGIW